MTEFNKTRRLFLKLYVPTALLVAFGLEANENVVENYPQETSCNLFERANVRKCLNEIKSDLSNYMSKVQFEMNDESLRAEVRSSFERVLEFAKSQNCIDDYRVVCDETINTPGTIDKGELNVTTFINQTPSGEIIILDMSIS